MPTIKEWTDRYIKEHPGKDGTIEQLEITARSLCKKFGNDKRIDTFTAGDAESYRKWLQTRGNERKKYKTGLATGTVRRRIGRSKQFFNAAIKHELIDKNPFAGEQSATTGNPDRLVMVPADWIEACIRKAPCEDWRIILALARYGGLRSHETRIQKWEDIDLPNNVMMVRSHKTPPVRRCPIFPELRPHLLRAREVAPNGAVYIQTRYGHADNILTTLDKIITRAGLVPWEKPMQNLRATRETELLAPLSRQGRDKLARQFARRGEQALRDDDAGEFRPSGHGRGSHRRRDPKSGIRGSEVTTPKTTPDIAGNFALG